MSRASHDERRNRLNGEADSKIRGAPNDINRRESREDERERCRFMSGRGVTGVAHRAVFTAIIRAGRFRFHNLTRGERLAGKQKTHRRSRRWVVNFISLTVQPLIAKAQATRALRSHLAGIGVE